jgi:hypothetical protein
VILARAASISYLLMVRFSTNFSMLHLMRSKPFCVNSGLMSVSDTLIPAMAEICAIAWPMEPAPITAIRDISFLDM